MLKNFSKGRSLGLVGLLLIGAFVLVGQTWYLVSMSPNDETVTLKDFDGFSSYNWISPLLLVCLAALATSAISVAATRLASLWLGAISSITLALLSAVSISRQDLSAVAKELEAATGIAATHGISGLEITTQPVALVSIGVFGATFTAFILAIISSKSWKARASKPALLKDRPVKDTISLWDEQR